jgi:hypothetical protein
MTDVFRTDRNAPPGWHTIRPRLVAHNARDLVEFLTHVFGASARYESTAPTIVEIGDSKIMASEATSRAARAAFLYVYMFDVEFGPSLHGRRQMGKHLANCRASCKVTVPPNKALNRTRRCGISWLAYRLRRAG